jgi:hypothetical protein
MSKFCLLVDVAASERQIIYRFVQKSVQIITAGLVPVFIGSRLSHVRASHEFNLHKSRYLHITCVCHCKNK